MTNHYKTTILRPEMQTREFDVLIVGAGPAGSTCALALKDSGLRVALIDKSDFPRDKVCGDAIAGRAIKVLNSISPELVVAFRQLSEKCRTTRTALIYNGRPMEFDWKGEAYTCARMHFDHFLFEQVRQHTRTEIFCNTAFGKLEMNDDGVVLTDKQQQYRFRAKVIIGADGAHSPIAKQLTQRDVDRDHYVGSVRAYYQNVAATEEYKAEIYFDKRFMPSYLWVFPLPNNTANVGFGMLSSEIQKKRINIKQMFYDFIEQTPELKTRFKDAEQIGELEGFGLPLGSRRLKVSGNRFMLTGDAASLIDPITGEGIGNAMLSGKKAADQVIKCFQQNRFDARYMQQYDDALFGAIGAELRMRTRAQRVMSKMPWLVDVVFMLGRNRQIKKLIQKQF